MKQQIVTQKHGRGQSLPVSLAVFCSPLSVLRREASLARVGGQAGMAGVGVDVDVDVLLMDRVRNLWVSRHVSGSVNLSDATPVDVRVSV